MKLIGIHGHAHSGKNTVAAHIFDSDPSGSSQILSFADPLKETCAKLFGLPWESFYETAYKDEVNPKWGVSPREIMQFVGTELVRNHLHELIPGLRQGDFWIKCMENRIEKLRRQCRFIIIPDVRFPNERDFILSQGGLMIHLTRPGADGKVGLSGHASETVLPNTERRDIWCINNEGTIDELVEKVNNFLSIFSLNTFSANSAQP